jgi:hypothetical protein
MLDAENIPVRFSHPAATGQAARTPMSTYRLGDKQLQGIALEAVLEKRRLDQALNAKEFALCAGVSYSTARSWFRLPGFPAFHGVIFWTDFERWRAGQYNAQTPPPPQPKPCVPSSTLPPLTGPRKLLRRI